MSSEILGEILKLEELINLISEKTGKYINQSMLADALSVTRQTISNRIKNESEVTVSELCKIENFYKIKLLNNTHSQAHTNIIEVDYYTDVFASCGNGNIVFSDEKIKLGISTDLIDGYSNQKEYSIINATGDSMSPTIENKDKLIVEFINETQIQDNKIYVFCFNNEIYVKRLSKNLDEIIIKSDNPEYRTRSIDGNTINEIKIIGKIVGAIKTFY